MICYSCGNQIEEDLIICPCCGAVQPNRYAAGQYQQNNQFQQNENCNVSRPVYNTTCLMGCILSCMGFFFKDVFFLFQILPIAGIIVSIIGLNNINTDREQGKILAIVGIVLGAIQVMIRLIVIALFVINSAGFAIQEMF